MGFSAWDPDPMPRAMPERSKGSDTGRGAAAATSDVSRGTGTDSVGYALL